MWNHQLFKMLSQEKIFIAKSIKYHFVCVRIFERWLILCQISMYLNLSISLHLVLWGFYWYWVSEWREACAEVEAEVFLLLQKWMCQAKVWYKIKIWKAVAQRIFPLLYSHKNWLPVSHCLSSYSYFCWLLHYLFIFPLAYTWTYVWFNFKF